MRFPRATRPVHPCSSPANLRWLYPKAGYWTSFTSSSTSPVAAEVDQEAGCQSGPPHVIETLGHIRITKRMAGLHLDKDATVYEKVSFIIPNIDAIVENLDALLLNHVDLGFP